MDVMRTGCSLLGTLEPEDPGRNQIAIANRLTGCFTAMLLYWHHFATDGKRINTETDDDSTAGHFLHLLHQKKPDAVAPPRRRCVLDSLRRARVQRLDIHRPHHCLNPTPTSAPR